MDIQVVLLEPFGTQMHHMNPVIVEEENAQYEHEEKANDDALGSFINQIGN